MRQQCFNVYKFDELSDAAKEKARDWYREASVDDNYFSEYVIEDFIERAAECGWTVDMKPRVLHSGKTAYDPSVYWSGFWSQGDGACFAGTWRAKDVDVAKLKSNVGGGPELLRIVEAFADFAEQYPQGRAIVTHSGRYSHEYQTSFETDTCVENAEDCFPVDVETGFIKASRDLMRWLYRQLEAAYEGENSDEAVDSNIEANEYEFTEDGKRSVVI